MLSLTTVCKLAAVCLLAAAPTTQLLAEKPTHSFIDEQATLARSGSEPAARNAAAQIFTLAGVTPELASAFGFQERIVQAEMKFRKGAHAPVHEADIVKAVNNLVSTISGPAWSRTDLSEVHRVRMLALPYFPQTLINHSASLGPKPEILSANMGPLEASLVSVLLIHQKLVTEDFQFTAAEKIALAKTDRKVVQQAAQSRSGDLRNAIAGGTSGKSMRDMLSGADHFFSDLGLEPVNAASAEVAQ